MESLQSSPGTKLITGEELLTDGDSGSCELIAGRIVEMGPTGDEHGFVEFNLGAELRAFVHKRKLGWVLGGEVGIYIRRNPDNVRAADIVFVSYEKLPRLTGNYLSVAPELVVEVMSPNDRWEKVRDKLADYFSIGIEQVWVVEPSNRKLLVYRSSTDIREYSEGDTFVSEGVLERFTLVVASLFSPEVR